MECVQNIWVFTSPAAHWWISWCFQHTRWNIFGIHHKKVNIFYIYDVLGNQWRNVIHKNRMTTRKITSGYWSVTSWRYPWPEINLTTSMKAINSVENNHMMNSILHSQSFVAKGMFHEFLYKIATGAWSSISLVLFTDCSRNTEQTRE